MVEPQTKIPAVFMRGGTSNALVFHRHDLPEDQAAWDDIFLAAIGSPDPNGRQLDGMGGGISSLSKVVVIGPTSRDDADVDYTFGQVVVDRPQVDYGANCGNMSSAVGPFAVDEGLVRTSGNAARVRIHNTNTGKIIISEFPLEHGRARVHGDYPVLGVAGTGARIRLSFDDPGGATTGALLPTGNVSDRLDVPDLGPIEASLIDATNAGVFVRADSVGLAGTEMPEAIEGAPDILRVLESIRGTAAVAMGLVKSPELAATQSPSNPKIAVVSPPQPAVTLSGERLDPASMDLTVRMVSLGRPHRAVPLTGAMCLAVAARITGTVVNEAMESSQNGDVRLAHPSGVIDLAADVRYDRNWQADRVVVYRTARRLMEGSVLIPSKRVTASVQKETR